MKFPYGVSDFYQMVTEGYFYVDRTDRIPLLEDLGKQLLFLRPRPISSSACSAIWRLAAPRLRSATSIL